MSGGYLRRYTELPSLIYMLTERKLTLLDPESWEDRNDSFYLNSYRNKLGLQTVLALCFTADSETYHHWSVFAPGSAGVCIEFKGKEFLHALGSRPSIRMRPVKYLKLTEVRRKPPSLKDLPFVKRYAFRHETEFRVVYESNKERHRTLDLPLPLSLVARITLSPWLVPDLSKHIKAMLRAIPGCSKLNIARSTLISNQEWKNLGAEAI